MKKNVGIVDRIVRFVIFDFIISFTYVDLEISSLIGTVGFWAGAYLLITIILGYDPIYHTISLNTRRPRKLKASTTPDKI